MRAFGKGRTRCALELSVRRQSAQLDEDRSFREHGEDSQPLHIPVSERECPPRLGAENVFARGTMHPLSAKVDKHSLNCGVAWLEPSLGASQRANIIGAGESRHSAASEHRYTEWGSLYGAYNNLCRRYSVVKRCHI